MAEDIFSYVLLIGIVSSGIWGISVKVRELSSFVKKNGWRPIRNKIKQFFINILRVTVYTIVGLGYLFGLVFIPIRFEWILGNEARTNVFMICYLFLGFLVFYYMNGTKRRGTKNPVAILSEDFISFKNGIKEFIQGLDVLMTVLFALGRWLLTILGVITITVLGVWLIVALGPLWIIAIILTLILLVQIGR